MATQTIELAPPHLPSMRCPQCALTQFRKPGRSRCVRCRAPLDMPAGSPVQLSLPRMMVQSQLLQPIQCKFAQIRRRKGITQHDLASAIGVPRTYISKIENARSTRWRRNWARLCAGIGVTIHDLFSEETPREIARRTASQGGTSNEILEAVAEVLPGLDREARGELLAIAASFSKRQLHFTEYTRIELCHSKKARAKRPSTAT